jgi:hypothetical protein
MWFKLARAAALPTLVVIPAETQADRRSSPVVIRLVSRMLHNNAMFAPDPHLGPGIRMLHDDAPLAADSNVSFRSLFPRPFV